MTNGVLIGKVAQNLRISKEMVIAKGLQSFLELEPSNKDAQEYLKLAVEKIPKE